MQYSENDEWFRVLYERASDYDRNRISQMTLVQCRRMYEYSLLDDEQHKINRLRAGGSISETDYEQRFANIVRQRRIISQQENEEWEREECENTEIHAKIDWMKEGF